jgi:hypothetical protein
MAGDKVSIRTLNGGEKIPFVCGTRQQALLQHRNDEADPMLVKGKCHDPKAMASKKCAASISASSTLPTIAKNAPTPGPR